MPVADEIETFQAEIQAVPELAALIDSVVEDAALQESLAAGHQRRCVGRTHKWPKTLPEPRNPPPHGRIHPAILTSALDWARLWANPSAPSMTQPATHPSASITAVILAGGRARRMGGGDKGLLPFAGRPMVEHILEALRPQVGALAINANRNLERYAGYGVLVLPDADASFSGPLAGMAAGLRGAHTERVLFVPCDSPLLPNDLAQRLLQALERDAAELAVAHDGERLQPVFSLLRRDLLPSLEGFLAAGERKIDIWYGQHRMALADLSDHREAFLNVNTPEEQKTLEARLAPQRGASAPPPASAD